MTEKSEIEKKSKEFDGFLFKSGNSHVVTIPRYLIRSGVIDPSKEYTFVLQEKEVESHEE